VPEATGYEVETRPVGGRRRHLILPIAAAVAIAVVGAAASLLTREPPRGLPIAQPEEVMPAASSVARARALPASVDCGAMRAFDCREAVDAAQEAIADVPAAVKAARAWPTLICGDNFDCPPLLLAASDPVGSVALTLSDRGVVWINVFRVAQPNRLNETRQVVETRVVRWFRDPA
jgi:hypothetical protein